jgi:hypothetical protein
MHRRDFIKAGLALSVSAAFAPRIALADASGEARIVGQARQALETHRVSLIHTDVVGIADFSRHCAEPRFHLVDMNEGKIQSFLVAHGVGSDPTGTGWLELFSNIPGSRATSSGGYLTRNEYDGQFGPARRLTGLDPENSNAYGRAIVIHGSDGVSADLAREGMIEPSWGCFAFAYDDINTILDRLGPGRLLHAFA